MSDIQVLCGSQALDIQILLCPIYFNGYNETLLSLNSVHSKEQCKGTPDFTADPPVLKFNFSITEEGIAACSSNMVVSSLNLKYFLSCSSYLFLFFLRSQTRWEQEFLQTSPPSSISLSRAWFAPRTLEQDPSPITKRWCTSSPVIIHCSIWSTTLRWACKCYLHFEFKHCCFFETGFQGTHFQVHINKYMNYVDLFLLNPTRQWDGTDISQILLIRLSKNSKTIFSLSWIFAL